MANWAIDNDDAERAANHYGKHNNNNPWVIEDENGNLWDEISGQPLGKAKP